MMQRNGARCGFTLIELLTVIAIIAILAAVLFPVFSAAMKRSQSSTCMSQMHEIGQAVKLYEADFGAFPAVLYQFAETGGGTALYAGTGTADAASSASTGALYRPLYSSQRYLKDLADFQCPHNPSQDHTTVTTVVGPEYGPSSGSTAVTYPGASTTVLFSQAMQVAAAKQNATVGSAVAAAAAAAQPAYYYAFDSYDIGPRIDNQGNAVKTSGGQTIMELHYSLDWTGGSGSADAPNQLKYPRTAPSNSTVITWCTYHSATANMGTVNVLLLSGSVKVVSAAQWASQGPLGYQE